MEFPTDIICVIREYYQPLTRPDWKHLQKMTHDEFVLQLFICYRRKSCRLFFNTFEKACRVEYEVAI